MKKKTACIIWIIVAVIAVAAAVVAAVVYKDEILSGIASVKEKIEKTKYARLCRDEYKDYADID